MIEKIMDRRRRSCRRGPLSTANKCPRRWLMQWMDSKPRIRTRESRRNHQTSAPRYFFLIPRIALPLAAWQPCIHCCPHPCTCLVLYSQQKLSSSFCFRSSSSPLRDLFGCGCGFGFSPEEVGFL